MLRRIALLLFVVLLVACEVTPEPSATTQVVQNLATPPELEAMVSSWLTEYYSQTETRSLHLEILPRDRSISEIDMNFTDLLILGEEPPEDWFATPLVREAIAVIVSPDITLSSLGLEELKDLFTGKTKSWETFAGVEKPVQLIIPFKGDIFRERFVQVVLDNSSFDPSAYLANTPQATLEYIRSKSGAIGFLPISQLEEDVGVVEIESSGSDKVVINPGESPLGVDIVAMSPEEPVGALREFLVWLQRTYLSVE